jgi:hypothetical protein
VRHRSGAAPTAPTHSFEPPDSTASQAGFELYKISAAFDGNESRRQHGLPLMDELTA